MTPPQSPRRPAIVCPAAPRRARATRSAGVQQGWLNGAARNTARRLRLPLLGGEDHVHAEAGPGVGPGPSKHAMTAHQGMTTAGAVENLVEAGWPQNFDLEPEALFGFAFSFKGL